MAKLTQDMKDMIAAQQCFIGTADSHGMPNVAPKRSTRVLNDATLIFTEGTGGITLANIKGGSKVVVAVVNRDIPDGYRFIGESEVQEAGDLYDAAAEVSVKLGRPKPLAVILVHIREIHSLKPGPMAGKKIA